MRLSIRLELFYSRAGVGHGGHGAPAECTVRSKPRSRGDRAHQLAQYEEFALTVEPIAVVVEIAQRERSRAKLALLLAAAGHHVERSLTVTKMLDLFSVVVCQEDVTAASPSPRCSCLPPIGLGIRARTLPRVEDSPLGIEGARRAECRAHSCDGRSFRPSPLDVGRARCRHGGSKPRRA